MREDDAKPVDLRKTKASALQALAAHGDKAAALELGRRGIDTANEVDVTALDYHGLRRLVLMWRDGATDEELARNRDLALRAQFELDCRYRVDLRRWERNQSDEKGPRPEPIQPPPPPWLAPKQQRLRSWQRPQGSKCYPSESDLARAALGRVATEYYAKAK